MTVMIFSTPLAADVMRARGEMLALQLRQNFGHFPPHRGKFH
jgi:hypothetical protein